MLTPSPDLTWPVVLAVLLGAALHAGWNALVKSSGDKPLDTALVYVSDHGESLGENNLYLHGLPYALAPQQQIHVPMLTWLSGPMQKRLGVRQDCLQKSATAPLTHDNLFHSMLGLLDVNTSVYLPRLDLFAGCR